MANQQPNAQWGGSANVQGDTDTMQRRLVELESTLQGLLQEKQLLLHEKQIQETDFAQKRAKFKEIFLQREDELIKEAESLRKEKEKMEAEMNDIKATAVLAEQTYREEVDEVRKQWKTEVGSMESIMTNAVALTTEETAVTYQKERDTLLLANEQLTKELQDLQAHLSDRNQAGGATGPTSQLINKPEGNLLTNVTRSIRSWSNTSTPTKDDSKNSEMTDEDLENSMIKAQKDAEMLRAVVVPLEEEIESLKNQLKEAENRRNSAEGKLRHAQIDALGGITTVDTAQSPSTPPEGVLDQSAQSDMDEKMQELSHTLEREKSSRSDLELYVAVLNKQRNVSQDEADKLRLELKDVCKLLEQEKQQHGQLKNTWHMANDQFLESQRLQMMDMRRMETVLTEEQQRQVQEMQRRDQEREEQERRVRELTELREKASKEQMKALEPQDIPSIPGKQPVKSHGFTIDSPVHSGSSSSTAKVSPQGVGMPNVDPDDLLQFESTGPSPAAGVENAPLHRSVSEIAAHSFADSAVQGLDGDSGSITSGLSLTEAQERAISSDTPESVEIKSVLASARMKSESFPSLAGKRIVSEVEWTRLQDQVKNAREKLGRPCDMCSNYELQLQTVQNNNQEVKDVMQTLKQELEQAKSKVASEQRLRSELEESLKNAAEDAQSQIMTATGKNMESEKFLTELRQNYLRSQNEMHDQMTMLLNSRDSIYQEVQRLQKENESLSAKRTLHTSIVRGEDFQLPTTTDDLQRLCVKYREDIITIKVNSEHTEESLRNEIGFLKDQLQAEQHTKNTLEETYQHELDESKEELIMLRSYKDEYEHEKKLREESDSRIQELQGLQKSTENTRQETIEALQNEIEELKRLKSKLEQDQRESRTKLQSLQEALDNSEALQRDFVRLSQSLQVQLENIRQKDNEVRWQHEDDVEKCSGCKQQFGSGRKKKQHCKHCGKIFCADCLTKHVESGPRRRRMPVCNICHTLLVNESAPYFSEEAPMTT